MNIINFRIELTNPFDRCDYFKNLGGKSGQVFGNKFWELEHSYYSPLLFDANVRWTHRTDHAGFEIGIGLLGYGIHFRIYDSRHWNYEKDTYSSYTG